MIRTQGRVRVRVWVRVWVRVRVTYFNQTGIGHQILGCVGVRVMHSRSDAPSLNPTHSILNCFFPYKLKTLWLSWTFHQEISYKKSEMSRERRMSVWWMESSDDPPAMSVFENGALLRLVKRSLKVRCRKHTEWVSSDAIVICTIIFSPFFPLFFCLVSLSNLASVLTVEHVESCDRHMTYP